MWSTVLSTSYGGFSLRRFFIAVVTIWLMAFLGTIVAPTPAAAADASWQDSNISHDGNSYSAGVADGTTPPGLSSGTDYYWYTEAPSFWSGTSNSHILFAPSGSINTASSLRYQVFEISRNGSWGAATTDTTITITPQASASSSSNAAWEGAHLSFDGRTLRGENSGPYVATTASTPSLPTGSQYYVSVDIPGPSGTATAHVVYFSPSANLTTATSATYATFTVDGGGTWSSSPVQSRAISVTPQVAAPGSSTSSSTSAATSAPSCAIDGIGWIVCPVSTFLAEGMDWVFEQLQLFMEYNLLTHEDTSLYKAWSIARTLANIAFVIAFLVIIYSQLTSVGVSNYGIKKLLPRLVIAAILVNLSFYICAVAVDISNILGHGIQQMFIAIRESVITTNPTDIGGWASITGFILAGGTAAAASAAGIGIAIASTGASPVAAALLLLPMLLSLLLAILVALVVLAARQAVITILIIISPLAFVAYLLPNTEDWFKKWRKTFMTLLIFFPAFSLIFGGSQLAGYLIRDNSDQIAIILLGMFVQVAPLVLTPMLIKLSGNLVGRIANIVNNPNKGLVDRTRNWAKGEADLRAKQNLARRDPVHRRQVFRRFALGGEHNRRKREDQLASYKARLDADWANTDTFSDINQELRQSQEEKQLGETRAELRYGTAKLTNVNIQTLDIDIRNAKATLDNINKEVDVQFKNMQTETSALNVVPAHLATQALVARTQAQQASVLDRRTHAAETVRQNQFAEAMAASESLQRLAGGIDPLGAQTALANAVDTMRSAYNKSVTEGRSINKHFNLSGDQRQKHALGEEFVATDAHGNSRTFRTTDVFTREAAIEDQINGQGTVKQATEIIAASGTVLHDYRTTISATMASSGFGAKTIWGGGKTIDDVAQGSIRGMEDILRVAAEAVAKGKTSQKDLAGIDEHAAQLFAELAANPVIARARVTDPAQQASFDANIVNLAEVARKTLTGDEKVNVKQNAREHILNIARSTDPGFDPET